MPHEDGYDDDWEDYDEDDCDEDEELNVPRIAVDPIEIDVLRVALPTRLITGDPIRARNRIEFIGVELEGAWGRFPEGESIIRDGSVQGFDSIRVAPGEHLQIGELPSPPLPLDEVEPWITRCHPQYVNKSCGFHIHMSFRSPRVYSRLMHPGYTKAIVDRIYRWGKNEVLPSRHPLWERLEGNNSYCTPKFYADAQSKNASKSYTHSGECRYTMVNYPYTLHGTLEVRVLPMFEKPEWTLGALREVIRTTNEFLVVTAKERAKPEKSIYVMDQQEVRDNIEEIL